MVQCFKLDDVIVRISTKINGAFFVLIKISDFRISTQWSFCGILERPTMLDQADARRVTEDTSGGGDINFHLSQQKKGIMNISAGIGIIIRYLCG